METVDIVDDYDRVIGTLSRKEAHQKGYNVRIAATLVFMPNGNVILQKISHKKNKDPLKWSYSSAGHVDSGETYPQAALRELKEELGIDGEIEEYIGFSRTVDEKTGQKKSFHRVYKVIHDSLPISFDADEIEEVKEFSMDQLSQMVRTNPFQFKQNLLEILDLIGVK